MFPLINKQETGVNLRRIMDMRGIAPKDVQEYLALGCVQSVYRWIDVPDIIVKPLDSRESRLCAYYEKLQEKRAA